MVDIDMEGMCPRQEGANSHTLYTTVQPRKNHEKLPGNVAEGSQDNNLG